MGKKGATRCPGCNSTHVEYQGQDEAGNQKWHCRECDHRFTYRPADVKKG